MFKILNQLNLFTPAIMPYTELEELLWRPYKDRIDNQALGMRCMTLFAVAIGSYYMGIRSVRALTDRSTALLGSICTGAILYLFFEAYRTDRAVRLDMQKEFEDDHFSLYDDLLEDSASVKILLESSHAIILTRQFWSRTLLQHLLIIRTDDTPRSLSHVQIFMHIVDYLAKMKQTMSLEDVRQMTQLTDGETFVKYALERRVIARNSDTTLDVSYSFWEHLRCDLDIESARDLVELGYNVNEKIYDNETLLEATLFRFRINRGTEKAEYKRLCHILVRAGATCDLEKKVYTLGEFTTVAQWLETEGPELLRLIRLNNQLPHAL